jgi:hypothetical protein
MYGDYSDKEFFKKLAAKAGVDNVPWVRKVISSSLLLENPKIRAKLKKFLSLKTQQNVKEDHPFLPAPPEDEIGRGDYELINVVTGQGPEYPARVTRAHTTEAGIIIGPIGSGKTTWLVKLGQGIHRKGINVKTGERDVAVWFFCTEGQIPAFIRSSAVEKLLGYFQKNMFVVNQSGAI